MKKFFFLLFIPLIAILFLQCTEQFVEPNDQETVLTLYQGEPIPNNLSFPGLLADGYTLTDIGATGFNETDASFDEQYTGDYEGLTTEEIAALGELPWYAQKVVGNVWQAQFESTDGVDVSYIDWGDNIESFSPTQGKPFRLEVTLYKDLDVPMTGYTMAVLANPSSKDEVQGTNKETYPGALATIASDEAKLVIQPYTVDASTLVWNSSSWDGAETSESVVFGVELNVAGKLIYGAAQHGWRPAQEGNYRITFYLEDSEVNLSNAVLGSAPEGAIVPVIDKENNITYIDIEVLPRTSGNVK